jgi:nucleoside-diphosphate-sugar epimerase
MLEQLGAVPVFADALDPHQVAEAVGTVGPDVIVHQLTAIGAVDTRHMDRDFAATNRLRTDGTDHLLAAGQAVGVRRFVAQSNTIVYGRTGAAVQTEELIRRRKFPLVGDGGAVWSFIHVGDAAEATVAAIEHGRRGVYNVVDDDPAPVAEWLPTLAEQLGAKKPMRVPRLVGRLFAGEAGVVMMTELRGASNAKAKRELAWRPAHPSWRQGLAAA